MSYACKQLFYTGRILRADRLRILKLILVLCQTQRPSKLSYLDEAIEIIASFSDQLTKNVHVGTVFYLTLLSQLLNVTYNSTVGV